MYCCVAFFKDRKSREAGYQRLLESLGKRQPFLGFRLEAPKTINGIRPCQDGYRKDEFIAFPILPQAPVPFNEDKDVTEVMILKTSPSEAWDKLRRGGRGGLRKISVPVTSLYSPAGY